MEITEGGVWYRLSPIGDPFGVSCDERGVFLGGVPLLTRVSDETGKGHLEPRSVDDLNFAFTLFYGFPVDLKAKGGSLSAIANALNRGEFALAKIAAVQSQLPNLPRITKTVAPGENTSETVFLLSRSGLLKKDWDPTKHPRWPAGTPDSIGGEFAPASDDGSDTSQVDTTGPRSQIVSDRCAEEWARAYEFCKNLETRSLLGTFGHLGFGRTYEQCVRGMVSAECGGNPVS